MAKRKPRPRPPKEPAAVWVPTAELVPWDKNPKVHEPGQVERVCESVRRTAQDAARKRGESGADLTWEQLLRDGWGAALTARVANKSIVAGHGRVLAAQRLGIPYLPVRFLDISEKQARRLARADNRLGEPDLAPWDQALLAPQLAEDFAEGGIEAIIGQGWSQPDIDLLTAGPPPEPEPEPEPEVKVTKIDTSKLKAEFWLTVRGPVPSQPEVLEQLVRALGEIEGVNVDVGLVK